MGIMFVLLCVYVFMINVLLRSRFMNDDTTLAKTLILLVAAVGGGLLLYVAYGVMPAPLLAFEFIHIDSATLAVGFGMFAVLTAYRIAMNRVGYLKRQPAQVHGYVFLTAMLLSLASCVAITAVR